MVESQVDEYDNRKVAKTLDDAIKISKRKWNLAEDVMDYAFDFLDRRCGFCDLHRMNCIDCEVKKKCNYAMAKTSALHNEVIEYIREMQMFLVDMKKEMEAKE